MNDLNHILQEIKERADKSQMCASFVAHAICRTDVPRLVEAVRVLAEEMNVIRQCGGLTEHDLAVQALQRATEILKGV